MAPSLRALAREGRHRAVCCSRRAPRRRSPTVVATDAGTFRARDRGVLQPPRNRPRGSSGASTPSVATPGSTSLRRTGTRLSRPDRRSASRESDVLGLRGRGSQRAADPQRAGRRRRALGLPPTVPRPIPDPPDRSWRHARQPIDWNSTRNLTSSFNCRFATGSPGVLSQHSYGWAVDINPLQNPYVRLDGSVLRAAAKPYVDRSRDHQGMIHPGDLVVRSFAQIGWEWGGDWTRSRTTCTSR